MVGRLVHHEEVRLAGKHHDDGRPFDLPARKHLHLTVIFTHSERGQKPADTLLIFSEMLRIKTSSPRFAVLDDLIPDGRLRVILILLLKERDADVPKEQDLAAGVRAVLAGKYTQETGLAGAVRCYEGDLVALVDVEADVLKQNFRPI